MIVAALARKDLTLLLRDKVGFFFTFFFPLIYAVFFGMIFSGQGGSSPGIAVVVVDEDGSDGSRAFVEVLTGAPELRVESTDRVHAEALVRKGKKTAYIVLTSGFGTARERMFWGDPARILIGVDPSRSAESGMLQGVVTMYAMDGFQQAFAQPALMQQKARSASEDVVKDESISPLGKMVLQRFFGELDQFMGEIPRIAATTNDGGDDDAGWQPIVIETEAVARVKSGPENSYEVSFPQAIVWGVFGCAAAFGISMVTERTNGTLWRLRMTPIRQSEILAGKAAACFVTTVLMVSALLVFGVVVFGVRPHSTPLLVASVISVGICFVGIMMFLSVLGRTEQAAGGIGWAVLLCMAMLGGGMIPLFIMPPWMQRLSDVSPVKWAILSLEGAIWRSFTPAEMLLPCVVLVGVGTVSFLVGARAFRWSIE